MRYADSKLLLKWSRLHLEIAVAKCPVDGLNMSADNIRRSVGFRKLRAWFVQLSPRAKEDARSWMGSQIEGVRKLLEQARATGEKIEMGDITIEVFDYAGAALEVPDFGQVPACRSSGAGLPGVDVDGNGKRYVQCPGCLARWFAHDIQFKIPNHEPLAV